MRIRLAQSLLNPQDIDTGSQESQEQGFEVRSSFPRGQNPRDLGPIALDMALEGTKEILQAVQSFGKGPVADTCPLPNATDRSKITDLQTYSSAALTDVSTCDDSYDEGGGNEPPQISQASQKAKVIIDILLVIANRL
ncbi:uncharacterized protein LOC111384903 [Olea europaea var. sylvestris]|uniref:uncharacterized protein LOC111384903 n=1 Tax=Olea europaea var. sylvestris TaxID=158386 RepID=UPI000C1D09C9|nr:uncharacterized protein LOC111384903 [Olea europaea var. sylvestris]